MNGEASTVPPYIETCNATQNPPTGHELDGDVLPEHAHDRARAGARRPWICVASIGVAVNCRASFVLMVMPRFSTSGRNSSKVFSTTSFNETSFNCTGAGRIAPRNCVTM